MHRYWVVTLLLVFALSVSCSTGDDDDDNNSGDDDTGDDDDDTGDDDNDTGDDDTSDDDDDVEPPYFDCEEGVTYEGDPPTIIRGPFLQQVDTGSVVMRWDTDIPANSVVKYGLGDTTEDSVCDFNDSTYHEMTVYNLQPGLSYEYIVRSNGAQSETYSFSSAPTPDEPFSVGIYGDSRSVPEDHRRVALSILDGDPDFVINVGDIVGSGSEFDQYDPQFFEPAKELFAQKPMYVSIGNHERESEHYYNLLALPGAESWYAFTYGNTRFISLNTNKLYLQGSMQYNWLEEELSTARENGAEWIVCYAHHPPWSEGWDSPGYQGEFLMRFTVAPLMEEYGVDAFFVGHTHDYERGVRPGGMLYVITGGGGASLDTFQQDFDWITVYEPVYHYVHVEIAGKTFYMEARDVDGTVIDQYQLTH